MAAIKFITMPNADISAISHSVTSANFLPTLLKVACTSNVETTSHHTLPRLSHTTATGQISHAGKGHAKYWALSKPYLSIFHGLTSNSHPNLYARSFFAAMFISKTPRATAKNLSHI